MPLRDHFHPPLANLRHWESFHAAWVAEIMRALNGNGLPPGCFAEAQVHIGSRVEIDVVPPATSLIMPTVFPDEIEVQVFRSSGGATLVGAIQLISPGNKDRRETRRAFAAKCASYLQQGIGLVIVDIVTERQANLHDELVHLLDQPEAFEVSEDPPLYTAAYRPRRQMTGDRIEIWLSTLVLGKPLPVLPLALRGVATIPVDLETTYSATCQNSRL